MLDASAHDLRVLRTVAQAGSFTEAARELGYTQSAVSRRIAALEAQAGGPLFVRGRAGVSLTAAGQIVLRHAAVVLSALEAAQQELSQTTEARLRPLRLGAFATAAASIVPPALVELAATHPQIVVTVRERTSAALARALRSGTLDLALLSTVAPFDSAADDDSPLDTEVLVEHDLLIAVGRRHRLAGRTEVDLTELAGERWAVAHADRSEHVLGVWPGVDQADGPYVVRDWLTKLQLVAAGLAVTTITAVLVPALPDGVRVLSVRDADPPRRRLVLAQAPGPAHPEAGALGAALRAAASKVPPRRT